MDTPDPQTTNAVIRMADTVLSILAPILVILIGWLVRKASGWFGVKTDEKQLAVLDEWALRGVQYAEEQAHKFTRGFGQKVEPDGKLNLAVDFVMTFIEKQGWHHWTRERVTKMVEAKVNVTRTGATATGSPSTTLSPPIR